MNLNLNLIKKHPLATTIVVILGGVVFFAIYNGGSKSAQQNTGMAVSGVDPATAATNAQLALQGQQIGGQLQALGIQSSTQLQLAQLQAQSDLATQAYQYQIANLQAGIASQHDQLAAAVATAQTQAQLEAIKSQNQTLIDQASIGAQSQIAAINASVAQAAVNAQTNIRTAEINAQQNIAMTQAQSAAYLGAARAGASASKTSSIVGGMLGLAAIFFCDANLKTVIQCVDSSACLDAVRKMPLNRFVYLLDSAPSLLGDDKQHIQTMAQDFYKTIGADDWPVRNRIDVMDMMGVMLGAIKHLDAKNEID